MTTFDTARLRALAEAATLNDDPGDWPIPEAVGWARDEDNQFVAAMSPKLVIALIDRLEELERLRGGIEWEIPTCDLESRSHSINCDCWGPREVRYRRKVGPWEPVEGDK